MTDAPALERPPRIHKCRFCGERFEVQAGKRGQYCSEYCKDKFHEKWGDRQYTAKEWIEVQGGHLRRSFQIERNGLRTTSF